MPQYVEFSVPEPQNEDEILVKVKAVAIKHFDKGLVNGTHYASSEPRSGGKVIGGDGVCMLPNGNRVYAIGISGMLAEKATINRHRCVAIPDKLDDATAAALPNAVYGAAMALRFKGNIQSGDTVLINGATGFTGRVALQLAKYYGAGKTIVTGRDRQSLGDLLLSGADEAISVKLNDDAFLSAVHELHQKTPIQVVIDYLWGRTAEIILSAIKGHGDFTVRTRFVSVGSVTWDLINLSAASLRGTDLQLTGSGLGAWSAAQVDELFNNILPETFALAADGKLKVETLQVPIADIGSLWDLQVPGGKRLVVTV
ncbi:zinc-binding alcohol dehydrogenase family protein [Mucilaginibacter sp. 21P]|uniref:quinone oxidoreductase family protein n=1 Tax=Mucilaginibacter sp. 21P TaxID=2778902 RepID=UPI00210560F6|nr:zinc-binding alcohol dehydrogenase family protein [Mucilaginibacter sp. 21P]